jgi:hypothetical protein
VGLATAEGDLPSIGPVPIVVYAAMFGATVAGQLVGMTADALVIGHRVIWVPLACSVTFEALVGAQFGAARIGRRLSWRECARVSAYYSLGLGSLSLSLLLWTLAAHRSTGTDGSVRGLATAVALVLAGLVVATVLRHALMVLVSRRRS